MACDHEHITPRGNSDPFGSYIRADPDDGRTGLYERVGVDAECADCGSHVKIIYSFSHIDG